MRLLLFLAFVADRVFGASVHTAFPAECGQYFVWQSLGTLDPHFRLEKITL